MNKIELNQYVFQDEITKFLDSLKHRIITKSAEYSRNNNAFHNFNQVASVKKQDPRVCLDGMNMKQISSYFDMIVDIENGVNPSTDLSYEKLGDVILYLAILHVMNRVVNKDIDKQDIPF